MFDNSLSEELTHRLELFSLTNSRAQRPAPETIQIARRIIIRDTFDRVEEGDWSIVESNDALDGMNRDHARRIVPLEIIIDKDQFDVIVQWLKRGRVARQLSIGEIHRGNILLCLEMRDPSGGGGEGRKDPADIDKHTPKGIALPFSRLLKDNLEHSSDVYPAIAYVDPFQRFINFILLVGINGPALKTVEH